MKPQLFGILNYTPDSFYDGGKNFAVESALKAAQKLLDDGATYIDVGAEATNPFVKAIDAPTEIARLSPILPTLLQKFPGKISLDTYHIQTLRWALKFGKPLLNDVSGLSESGMVELVAEYGLTCIVGHLPPEAKGIPIDSHSYKMDDFNEVVAQLLRRASELESHGIKKEHIILDPNIGFGKTMKLNWQLLTFAKAIADYKVMIGHSNKRFLGCDPTTGELLGNGQELRFSVEQNLQAAQIAKDSGATYLRVHAPILY
jgi:dihydropteroate synthase